MIFVAESTIKDKRDQLVRFLRASLRGWKYAISNPEKAVDLVASANPELKHDEQLEQLRAVNQLILNGISESEIGAMKPKDYETMLRVLKTSGQLPRPVRVNDLFDDSLWSSATRH